MTQSTKLIRSIDLISFVIFLILMAWSPILMGSKIRTDSTIIIFKKKLLECYKQDSLRKYCYTAMDFSDFLTSQNQTFKSTSSAFLLNLWRQPNSLKEYVAYRSFQANLGYYYDHYEGDYSLSTFYYEKALNSDRHINDSTYSWYILNPLANNYTRLGDYKKAILIFKECENYLKAKKHYVYLMRMYVNMAKVYKDNGDIEKAIETCFKVIKSSHSKTKALVNSLLYLANLYYQNNEIALAKHTLTKLEKPLQKLRIEAKKENIVHYFYERVSEYYLLESLLSYSANKSESLQLFNISVEYLEKVYFNKSRREFGKYYIAYNKLLLNKKDYAKSFFYANKAILSVIPKYDTVKLIPQDSLLYPENTIQEALTLKGKAYELLYQKTKKISDLKNANKCYNSALKVAQLLRNKYIFNESEYISLQDNKDLIDASLNNYYELFTYKNTDVYLGEIQNLLIDSKANVLEKKKNFTYAIKMMTDKNKLKYQNLVATIDSFKTHNITNSSYLSALDKMKVFQQSQLKKFERPTEILSNYIEYFVGAKNTFAFIKNDSKSNFIKIGETDSILLNISKYRELINQYEPNKNKKEFEAVSMRLYNQLIKPLGILPEKLNIIPDEELSQVSFDGLINNKKEKLIKSHSISYYFQALKSINNTDFEKNKNFTIFTPKYKQAQQKKLTKSRDKLYAIPGAKQESEEIKAMINGNWFIDENANKENFLSHIKNADIMHFAGHAVIDDSQNGFLAFNSKEDSDFRIFAKELDTLNLDVNLLTLSACNTASGKIQSGEGTFSLARTFHGVGAESIVSALWEISDQTSSQIMIAFYKYLKKGQAKDVALRNAKLEYLENADPDYQHPYYWAGIIAMGDMSPLYPKPTPKIFFILGGLVLLFGSGVIYNKRRKTKLVA